MRRNQNIERSVEASSFFIILHDMGLWLIWCRLFFTIWYILMIYPNTELSLSVSSMLLRWRIVLMNFLMIVLHVFPAPSQKVVALRDVLCWIFVLMVVYVDVSPDISPNTLVWRSRIGQMRSTILDPPSVCTMTSFFSTTNASVNIYQGWSDTGFYHRRHNTFTSCSRHV